MSAPARYATPRDPARATDGPRIARIAAALGKPLLPWQRQVLDTATERDEAGNLVYEIVFVTVPRQSGKTTMLWALVMDRLLTLRNHNLFFTAQTQQDARKRVGDFAKLVADSPFSGIVAFTQSLADTGARCKLTGTRLNTFAPSMKAIHGETPPLVILDEIFALSSDLGDAMLEEAIIPAQQTLTGNRQVWLVSTAGTAESTFMRKWLDIGRAGDRDRMAFFEWSMPDGLDPLSIDTLESFHPGVGHLVTAEDLLASRPARMAAWLRGFCNRFTETTDSLIDLDAWDALPRNTTPPALTDLAIAFESELDSSSSSVVAAWRDDTGAPHIHTLHTAPGTSWLPGFMERIAKTWQPRTVVADNGGTTRRLIDEVTARGIDVQRLTGTDFAVATDTLLAAARDGTLHHDGSTSLRRGIASAVLQRTGDTARFSRALSPGYVAAIIAAAAALRGIDHAPAIAPKPLTRFA